jgi:hypothetical protein
MKTKRRRIEDAMKETKEDCIPLEKRFQWENRRKRSKKLGRGDEGWEKKM